MKKCFIVSPIGNEGSETRKRADQLFKHIISPVCEKCGFEAIRVDQINQADSITQTIIDYLNNSELVIADLTEHNPNAFYEIGYRASTGKPIIHIKEKGEGIPFDIANIRAFDYDLKDLDLVDEIKTRLEQTINAFDYDIINSSDYEKTQNNEIPNQTSKILPILFQIQDQISQLRNDIHEKDTETIQTIVKASQPSFPIEDPNTAIMKAILPELIKNPEIMKNIMQIGEIAKNNNL